MWSSESSWANALRRAQKAIASEPSRDEHPSMGMQPDRMPLTFVPPAAVVWQTGGREYRFPRPTLVMGILNVTPDSFSDGGKFFAPEAAVTHALELEAEGADIIDVGGESTRPHAVPVDESEELRRVLPVLERIIPRLRVPVSIDTQKPAVAQAALERGATIVNDVAANRQDSRMAEIVATHRAGYVLMHMRRNPQSMQTNPTYANVTQEVYEFLAERLDRLKQFGVPPEQVVLDVGIGFGKTSQHNLELLAGLNRFTSLMRPLLLGVSRKSFLGHWLRADISARLPGALACACWAALAGVQIIRTHDVAATVQALRMTELLQRGAGERPDL